MKPTNISDKDQKWLNGRPTRMEVSNYVNSLLEQYWMPRFQQQMQLSVMVIQGILLKKNLCTPEDIKQITEEFIKEATQRAEESNKSDKDIKSNNVLEEIESILLDSSLSEETIQILTQVKNINHTTNSLNDFNRVILSISKLNPDKDSPLYKLIPKINDYLLNLKKKLLH